VNDFTNLRVRTRAGAIADNFKLICRFKLHILYKNITNFKAILFTSITMVQNLLIDILTDYSTKYTPSFIDQFVHYDFSGLSSYMTGP